VSFQIIAATSVVSLLGASLAVSGETRALQAIPAVQSTFADGEGGGMGEKCRVDVIRSATSGGADITRQVLENGGCVCTVEAGPIGSDAPAEGIISNLLRDRECQNAPTTPAQRQPVEATGGGGGIPGAGLIMGGAALAGLGLAAAGGGGSDSRG